MRVFEIISSRSAFGGEKLETFHVERHTMGQAIGVVEMAIERDAEVISARMIKTTLVPFRKEVV